MKKKLIIDLCLFIMMFFLMFYNLTGGLMHEILGIALFILYLIHIMLNIKLLKRVIFKIKEGEKLPKLIIIQIVLDIIMFVVLIMLMISGILISQYIFKINLVGTWTNIHVISSYILFGIVVIHLLLHIKMISNYLANKLNCDVLLINIIFILTLGLVTLFVYKDLIFKKKNLATTTNNNTTSSDKENNNTGGTIPTLQEYLSGQHCSGCHNHCALSSIKCNRGTSAKETATSEYYNTYATAVYSQAVNDVDNNINL